MATRTRTDDEHETLGEKLPLAAALIAGGMAAYWLSQHRDGWAENLAWFALSMCVGGLYGLFGPTGRRR